MHLLVLFVIMSSLEQGASECANEWGFVSMEHYNPIRWYNPKLENFEWREVPQTDEQALEALGGSSHSPAYTEIYREWRELGASIGTALMRAGEAARAERDEQEREGDHAR
jgi:hypothetical protein